MILKLWVDSLFFSTFFEDSFGINNIVAMEQNAQILELLGCLHFYYELPYEWYRYIIKYLCIQN